MEESSYTEFEQLFQKYHKGLCDMACNIVRDEDAAKDIVQDVFFKLWKNRNQLNFDTQIRHYLFKATTHTSLNYLRKNKRIVNFSKDTLDEELLLTPKPEVEQNKELEHRVRLAIEKLPPKCKTIYLLSRHDGLKYQEIAKVLDISQKTVENQMGIALQKLREELKPFLTLEFFMVIIIISMTLFILF